MNTREWMKPLVMLGVLAFAAPVQAAQYQVEMSKSSLGFSGTHAGKPFTGAFGVWNAKIAFDPKALDKSVIDVTVDVASAKTGNSMYDGTLPTADWFDVKKYPSAHFVSSAIHAKSAGVYTAEGTLELRGKTLPVKFDFMLSDTAAPEVNSTFSLTLNRMDFEIGVGSDAKAEWVSRDITLDVKLVAKAVQG